MRCILILAMLSGAAHAEFLDGNKLHGYLTSESTTQRAIGIGYVMGVADAMHGVAYCPPETVTAGQMRDMVSNYLANVPADRHLSADLIVSKVLKSVWPCAQRPPAGRSL